MRCSNRFSLSACSSSPNSNHPDSKPNQDRFSPRTCSMRQLSLKCARWAQILNKSCHAERVVTSFYKIPQPGPPSLRSGAPGRASRISTMRRVYSRGSIGSRPIASTANTHSWTERGGSRATKRLVAKHELARPAGTSTSSFSPSPSACGRKRADAEPCRRDDNREGGCRSAVRGVGRQNTAGRTCAVILGGRNREPGGFNGACA
jgi:hypothetical protein